MIPHNQKPPRRHYQIRRQQGGVIENPPGGRQTFHAVVIRINVFHPVCSAMFGKTHSAWHRICTGVVVAVCGVILAKWMGHSHNEYISHAGDFVGYGLHGLGLMPLLEKISEIFGGAE